MFEAMGRALPYTDRMVSRTHDEDRVMYEATKTELAARVWKYTQNYADAKGEVIQRILSRARREQE
jgi:GrpB-like predicted nucleotidyltransferase (UPF0157 family)